MSRKQHYSETARSMRAGRVVGIPPPYAARWGGQVLAHMALAEQADVVHALNPELWSFKNAALKSKYIALRYKVLRTILPDNLKVLPLLKRAKEWSKLLAGRRYVTISLVLPMAYDLLAMSKALVAKLATVQADAQGHVWARELQQGLKRQLEPLLQDTHLQWATALDFRVCTSSVLKDKLAHWINSLWEHVQTHVTGWMTDADVTVPVAKGAGAVPSWVMAGAGGAAVGAAGKVGAADLKSPWQLSHCALMAALMEIYPQNLKKLQEMDLLAEWKRRSAALVLPARVARSLLYPPATGVSVESYFNIAGTVASSLRSRLLDDHVSKLSLMAAWAAEERAAAAPASKKSLASPPSVPILWDELDDKDKKALLTAFTAKTVVASPEEQEEIAVEVEAALDADMADVADGIAVDGTEEGRDVTALGVNDDLWLDPLE